MSLSNKSNILSNDDLKRINSWINKLKEMKPLDKKQRVKKAKSKLKLNYKKIGAGCNRIVYDINHRYVLKVAITKRGIKNNEIEFNIYKHCPDQLREHLCPVKEIGYGWIIMDKMSKKVPKSSYYNRKRTEMFNEFKNNGIEAKDLQWSNLALSKSGKITVFDYGNFNMPSKNIIYKKKRKK
ncbi:hypothetical protein [Scopulibacillus cellulosilyticus]|uniref:Serine/threonine protein kinase n=1 Tax=Scopulibacillus cellulosilyticus TaxID=2665665 RepID=A0ABW2Q084_9BACL